MAEPMDVAALLERLVSAASSGAVVQDVAALVAQAAAAVKMVKAMTRAEFQHGVVQTHYGGIAAPVSVPDLLALLRIALAAALDVSESCVTLLLACPSGRPVLYNVTLENELAAYLKALEERGSDEDFQSDDDEDEDVVAVDETGDVVGQAPAAHAISLQRGQSLKASQLRVSLGLEGARSSGSLASKGSFSRSRHSLKVSPGVGSPLGRGAGVRFSGALSPASGVAAASSERGRRPGMAAGGTAGLMGLTFSPQTPVPQPAAVAGAPAPVATPSFATAAGGSLFNLAVAVTPVAAAPAHPQPAPSLRSAQASFASTTALPREPSIITMGQSGSLQSLARSAMLGGVDKLVIHREAKLLPWSPEVSPSASLASAPASPPVESSLEGASPGASFSLKPSGSFASVLTAVTEESAGLVSTHPAEAGGTATLAEEDKAHEHASPATSTLTPHASAELPPCTAVVVAIPGPGRGAAGDESTCVGALILSLPLDMELLESDIVTIVCLSRVAGSGLMHVEEKSSGEQAKMRSLAMVQMIQAVSHEVTVPAIITRIVGVAYELLQADRVSVFLVDRERQEIVLAVSEDAAGLRLPIGKGIVGHCASTGSIVNIADAYLSGLFDRSFDERTGYRTRSVLAFPVRDVDGGVSAVIQAINKHGGQPFSPADIRMLGLVADTAGVTLHKAKLLQDALLARAANEALVDVVKLSSELDSFEDLETLTSALTEIAQRLVDAERIQLFLVDDVKKELFASASSSADGYRFASGSGDSDAGTVMGPSSGGLLRVPMGHSIIGACAVSGQTITISNAYADGRFDKSQDEKDGFKTRNLLAMAVQVRVHVPGQAGKAAHRAPGKVVAVIYAVNKRGAVTFSASDEELLSAFSTEVATTIDKRALQLALSKAVADEAEGSAAAGGAGGPGKMSSLLGQYVRHQTNAPTQVLRAAPSARRMSYGSDSANSVSASPPQQSRRGSSSASAPATATKAPQDTPILAADSSGQRVEEASLAAPTGAASGAGAARPAPHTATKAGLHAGKASVGAASTPVKAEAAMARSTDAAAPAATTLPVGRHRPEHAVGASAACGVEPFTLDMQPWRSVGPRAGRSAEVHIRPQSWSWDILQSDDLDLCGSVLDMLHTFDLFSSLRLDIGALASFVDSVRVAYRPNPYHNFKHGVSVAHVCFLALFHAPLVGLSLNHVERLALLLSALCHDVDHPGVNNAYESNALTPLAIMYNDVSVLEHHHAAVLFELLRAGDRSRRPVQHSHGKVKAGEAGGDRLAGLHSSGAGAPAAAAGGADTEEVVSILGFNRAAFNTFRRTAIAGILATDMTHHQDLTEQARKRALPVASAGGGEALPGADPLPAKLMVELLVHSADLSNPVLPVFTHCQSWAARVCEEFTAQVAAEKAMGLPFAPHMDGLSNPASVAKLQLGFIDYVVAPLWTALSLVLPEFRCAADNMTRNKAQWRAILDEGTSAAAASVPSAAPPAPADKSA